MTDRQHLITQGKLCHRLALPAAQAHSGGPWEALVGAVGAPAAVPAAIVAVMRVAGSGAGAGAHQVQPSTDRVPQEAARGAGGDRGRTGGRHGGQEQTRNSGAPHPTGNSTNDEREGAVLVVLAGLANTSPAASRRAG